MEIIEKEPRVEIPVFGGRGLIPPTTPLLEGVPCKDVDGDEHMIEVTKDEATDIELMSRMIEGMNIPKLENFRLIMMSFYLQRRGTWQETDF